MTYTVSHAVDADAAYMPIWTPLLQFNEQSVGNATSVPFALTITGDDKPDILGGLWAMSLWGSFYIALVVTPPAARGQGLGRNLMQQAETEALSRNCRHMWLDTYAFQARGFYERLGFSLFGQLDGPAPMFPRYFLRKNLPNGPSPSPA